MYKLVISDDEGKTTVVPLVRDEITIGRKEGNIIRLTERNVSRRHALLQRDGASFVVHDLRSYNGVRVNGRRMESELALKSGDTIAIGDYLLALQLESSEQVGAGIAVSDAPVAPPRLVMLTQPAPGAEFAISEGSSRVGRAEDLDIWVNHRSISREHAQITREGDRFKIEDLGSANGIRHNGRDVSVCDLRSGDVLELGQVRMRFVGEGESYVLDPPNLEQLNDSEYDDASRVPLFVAAGILLVALTVGAAIAALGGGGSPPTSRPIEEPLQSDRTLEGVGSILRDSKRKVSRSDSAPSRSDPATRRPSKQVPGQESRSPETNQALSILRSRCSEALAASELDVAEDAAAEALAIAANDRGALECQSRVRAHRVFDRALELARTDVDAAFATMLGIPEDSALRQHPKSLALAGDYAQRHMRRGRQVRASRSWLALRREAQSVLTADVSFSGSVTEGDRVQAQLWERRARREVGVLARQAESQDPPPNSPAVSQIPVRSEESAMERARSCLLRSDHQCVIRTLKGRTGASELALLVATYRQVGDTQRMRQAMQRYLSLYPRTDTATQYRGILERLRN
ncbi:MAG: FHA domain-containing protein [Myxococcota bacterium]